MANQDWTEPNSNRSSARNSEALPLIQAVDIAPEKKRRFAWLTPTTVFAISMVGYLFDGLRGTPGKVFNLIGLIGLVAGFIMLVEITVASGIHRKFDKRQLLTGWLLLVATILVGIYI